MGKRSPPHSGIITLPQVIHKHTANRGSSFVNQSSLSFIEHSIDCSSNKNVYVALTFISTITLQQYSLSLTKFADCSLSLVLRTAWIQGYCMSVHGLNTALSISEWRQLATQRKSTDFATHKLHITGSKASDTPLSLARVLCLAHVIVVSIWPLATLLALQMMIAVHGRELRTMLVMVHCISKLTRVSGFISSVFRTYTQGLSKLYVHSVGWNRHGFWVIFSQWNCYI